MKYWRHQVFDCVGLQKARSRLCWHPHTSFIFLKRSVKNNSEIDLCRWNWTVCFLSPFIYSAGNRTGKRSKVITGRQNCADDTIKSDTSSCWTAGNNIQNYSIISRSRFCCLDFKTLGGGLRAHRWGRSLWLADQVSLNAFPQDAYWRGFSS